MASNSHIRRYIANLLMGGILCLPIVLNAQTPIFREVAEETGMSVRKSKSVSIVDFNNDGADDVMITRNDLYNLLYRNNQDGTFTEISLSAGLRYFGKSNQTVWADINADGYQDLYLATSADEGNRLYLNNGDETFTDITETSGIGKNSMAVSSHWADVNADGLPDLFVFNLNSENDFFLNNGDGTFQDYTAETGIVNRPLNMGSVFFDFDKDGDLDVFTSHDNSQGNYLYQNDGSGHFADVSLETGIYSESQGMAASVGDFNNDGWPDVYLTNLYENFLFKNIGGERFEEIGVAAGVADRGMGWGVSWLDYDNDGLLDLYVANDSHYSDFPNVLYRNNGDESFTAVETGLPLSSKYGSYSSAITDIDRDGDLDILVSNRGPKDHAEFFINEIDNSNKWLIIKIKDDNNSSIIGAEIKVTTNGNTLTRYTFAGTGWQSNDSEYLHFGLGSQSIREVEVRWPDGTTTDYSGIHANEAVLLNKDGSKEDMVYHTIPVAGNVVTSVEDELSRGINLFPNPSHDVIAVDLSHESFSNVQFEVITADGTSKQTTAVMPKQESVYQIDISDMVGGLYFLRIALDDRVAIKRFLKANN